MADIASSIMADEHTGKPVLIRWTDSGMAVHGWTDRHDLPDNVEEVETVGFWVGENDEVVATASTRDAQGDSWLNVQLIWKPSITHKEWM